MENVKNRPSPKEYIRSRICDKRMSAVLLIYSLFTLASSIFFCVDFNLRNLLMSLLFTLFAPLFWLAEWLLGMKFSASFTAAVLSIAAGSILGSCYDLYTFFPFFDTLLHGISGTVFALFGFYLGEKIFKKPDTGKGFAGLILFGFTFSLAVAAVWEMFEFSVTLLFGFDMMEDSIVDSISSYLLAGTHNSQVELDGITKTVIHYGDGMTYTLDGYLDLGLIDTLTDISVCFGGALLFAIAKPVASALKRSSLTDKAKNEK